MQSKQGVSSQYSEIKTERLRTFSKQLMPPFYLGFCENVGFVSTVQDLMKRKKITRCKVGWSGIRGRLWE